MRDFVTGEAPDPRRWLILGTVGLAQLMVVLDSRSASAKMV